jgi:hypothetical protein
LENLPPKEVIIEVIWKPFDLRGECFSSNSFDSPQGAESPLKDSWLSISKGNP